LALSILKQKGSLNKRFALTKPYARVEFLSGGIENAMNVIEERVARGAALLDEYVPAWFNKVDLDRLDIGNCTNCILGQVFGSYQVGFNTLAELAPEKEFLWEGDEAFGFSETAGSDADELSSLNRAWRVEIEKRTQATPIGM
jgi:hypothetical protein